MTFAYQTSRLSVAEVFSSTQENETLVSIIEILTPKVVENLPAYFQNINSISDAHTWFQKMVTDSRLFMLETIRMRILVIFLESQTGEKVTLLSC